MSRQKTTAVDRTMTSKRVRIQGMAVLAAALLFPLSWAHAAQPLTDAELDHRYLAVDAHRGLVLPMSPLDQPDRLMTLVSMTLLPTVNFDAMQTMLSYQGNQLSAGTTGAQANGQKTFEHLIASNIGSERYSFRWAGNLQDIIQISDLASFIFNFNDITDVELVGFDTNIGIEVSASGRRYRH
jgi:hypothetical protein